MTLLNQTTAKTFLDYSKIRELDYNQVFDGGNSIKEMLKDQLLFEHDAEIAKFEKLGFKVTVDSKAIDDMAFAIIYEDYWPRLRSRLESESESEVDSCIELLSEGDPQTVAFFQGFDLESNREEVEHLFYCYGLYMVMWGDADHDDVSLTSIIDDLSSPEIYNEIFKTN